MTDAQRAAGIASARESIRLRRESHALNLAHQGYGWEDIVVISREWDWGPISEDVARDAVWKVQG